MYVKGDDRRGVAGFAVAAAAAVTVAVAVVVIVGVAVSVVVAKRTFKCTVRCECYCVYKSLFELNAHVCPSFAFSARRFEPIYRIE